MCVCEGVLESELQHGQGHAASDKGALGGPGMSPVSERGMGRSDLHFHRHFVSPSVEGELDGLRRGVATKRLMRIRTAKTTCVPLQPSPSWLTY